MSRRHRTSASPPMQMPTNAQWSPDAPRPFAPATRRTQRGILQTRLVVTPAGDRYEQEADRVASSVVSSLPALRAERGTEVAQRQAAVQLQAPTSGAPVDSAVEASLTAARSGGSPLNSTLRAPLERAFGSDFSAVRLHTTPQADSLNRSLSARAFTTGSDIFFRQGEYEPSSSAGQQLLAHELTHVVQQAGGAGALAQRAVVQRSLTPQNPNWGEAFKVKAVNQGKTNRGIIEISSQGGETVVAKFTDEKISSANTFGDRVMGAVGLANPDTVPLPQNNPGFAAVINAIQSAVGLMRARGEDKEADNAENLMQQKGAAASNGLLLMRRVVGVDFGNQMEAQSTHKAEQNRAEAEAMGGDRNFDVMAFITQPTFIGNLGRMAVADALIGNQDRLSIVQRGDKLMPTFNPANFNVLANGVIGTFDHDTKLYGRQFLAQESKDGNPETWFDVMTKGEDFTKTISERPVPSLGAVFTAAGQKAIYTEIFGNIRADLTPTQREELKTQFTFAFFQPLFQAGLQAGLISIAQNAAKLRKDAAEMQDGELLDPEALDVRLAFIKAKAAGVKDLNGAKLTAAMDDNQPATDSAKNVATALLKAKLSEKMQRVLSYGKGKNILDSTHEMTLKLIFGNLSSDVQEKPIEVRPFLDKRLKGDNQRDDKFEQLRAKLLKQFIEAYDHEAAANPNIAVAKTQAYKDALTEAKRLQKVFGSKDLLKEGGYSSAVWSKYAIA